MVPDLRGMPRKKQKPSPDEFVSTVVKIVLLGDGAVGKTTFVEAIQNYVTSFGKIDHASQTTQRTRFIDFHVVPHSSANPLTYSVWDVQGQRNIACHPMALISQNVLGGAGMIVFMFAMNDAQSFENLFVKDGWYELAKEIIETKQIPVLVLGNKADTNHEVLANAAEKIAKRLPTCKGYLTISALTGQGIKEAVDLIKDHASPLFGYQLVESEKILSAKITRGQKK